MLPRLVARPDEKMIRRPSVLHASPSMGLAREVSFRSCPPEASMRQISSEESPWGAPERNLCAVRREVGLVIHGA